MRTTLELPELQKLRNWALETLDVVPDASSSERTTTFLNKVIENEGFVSDSKWHAFQLLTSLDRNSVIPARYDSEFANLVHDRINDFTRDYFTIAPSERKQRFKLLQMIASKDTLLSLRIERLKPFLDINIHSQKLPSKVHAAVLELCQAAIASIESRRKTWIKIYTAAGQEPGVWKQAAILLQKQLTPSHSSIINQLAILAESDFSKKKQKQKELRFYFRHFRLVKSPSTWLEFSADNLASKISVAAGIFFIAIAVVLVASAQGNRRKKSTNISDPYSYTSSISDSGSNVSEQHTPLSDEEIKRMVETYRENSEFNRLIREGEERMRKMQESFRNSTSTNASVIEGDRQAPTSSILAYPPPATNYTPPKLPDFSIPRHNDEFQSRIRERMRPPDVGVASPNSLMPRSPTTPYTPGVRP